MLIPVTPGLCCCVSQHRIIALAWPLCNLYLSIIILRYFQAFSKGRWSSRQVLWICWSRSSKFWQINQGPCYSCHIDFYYIIKDNCFQMGKFRDVYDFNDNLFFYEYINVISGMWKIILICLSPFWLLLVRREKCKAKESAWWSLIPT